MTLYVESWNRVQNIPGFTTDGTHVATPLAAPATLPQTGVAPATAEALDYVVRFTSYDGTTLTLDGNQLFALQNFSFGATQTLNIGSQSSGAGAGKVAFNALSFSLGDAALNPTLFAQLASGTAFKEVDVLGYRPSDGKLISDDSFGLLAGNTLTVDQSGLVQYSAEYGSIELQHNSQSANGSLVADTPSAWNEVRNANGFSTDGSTTATPLAAPATLPQTGVAPATTETLDYVVRFTSYDGTTLTFDGNQLFALQNFSFGATQTLNIGSQSSGAGAGKVSFNQLNFSFGDAALNGRLFAQLASGTPFKEVDVLGYRPSDGQLISDDSFGLLAGKTLTVDQSGLVQFSAEYGSVELQHNSQSANGSLVADAPSAWNEVRNVKGFSTDGSTTATPLAAPATLPQTGVATATTEAIDYFVRFTSYDGTTLTLDGNQLFALQNFSVNFEQTLNIGSQSSGAGAGKVTFNPLSFSLGDAALNPRLFVQLASGTAFKEVDVLGYRPSDGALISDDSFGLLAGKTLTLDQSGVVQFSAEYGSVELQHNSQSANGLLVADAPYAWNVVRNVSGFSADGTHVATPLAAPATLPNTGVAPATAEALDYVVRFTSYDGTTLTLHGNELFALQNFSFNFEQTLNIGSQSSGAGAGKVTFNPLSFSLDDAALNPRLFADLASGIAFKEVDVLGYRPGDGALISDDSFGLLAGSHVTIDQSGVLQYTAEYGSVELQHNSPSANGSLIADTPSAWNRVKNISGFSTDGTHSATPLAAPATLPQTGVASATAQTLDYVVRFTSSDGTTLTLDGNQLFALNNFSFGADQTLNIGSQSSGAGAGKLSFNQLSFSLGDAALNPGLFAKLASGTAFQEVDVLGYRPGDGSLISDDSFGLVGGQSLTIDQSGLVQYTAEYGSLELQHLTQLANGSLSFDAPSAWNQVTNTPIFSTNGSTSTSPLAAPARLPQTGVAPATAEALDYFVRFTSYDGTTLTVDGKQLFALGSFGFGATQTLNIGSQSGGIGAGKVTFNALNLSLGDAALNPHLFADLASGTAFKEVDVLGYRPSDGALISDDSFGLLGGKNLTVDQSGVAQYSAEYGSVELQYSTDTNPPCYCRGTRILTERGQVAVENLAIGDRVVTASGGLRPIIWLGHRRIDIARHPDPTAVWPIRVSTHAFGPNKPSRDLWLSPGHNILAAGVLMPANLLVNGKNVAQHERSNVEYWHVELDQHDIILAEGLEAESYLDTGNRTAFVNGGDFIEAHPDFTPKHWADTCAPLIHAGPEITRTKALLIERAGDLGFTVTHEADLHILADETRIEPIQLTEDRLAFVLPAGCREILLSSRTFIPAHTCPDSRDGRELGIDVARLMIDGDEISLDSSLLSGGGWNDPERSDDRAHRWTTGLTPLPAASRLILIDLARHGFYWTTRQEHGVGMSGGSESERLADEYCAA